MKALIDYARFIGKHPRKFIRGIAAGLKPHGTYDKDAHGAVVAGYVVGGLGPWIALPLGLYALGATGGISAIVSACL